MRRVFFDATDFVPTTLSCGSTSVAILAQAFSSDPSCVCAFIATMATDVDMADSKRLACVSHTLWLAETQQIVASRGRILNVHLHMMKMEDITRLRSALELDLRC